MQRRFVASDPEKCIGCKICEYVCSAEKEKAFNPLLSRIRTVRIKPTNNIAIACRLCEDAPCVHACPRDALEQSEEKGIILIDEEKCTGCGWCIEACDFGAITLHPERRVVMACDLCGGDPRCVQYCPKEGALLHTTLHIMSQKARRKAVSLLRRV